ncbi:MAG: amidohydrolase family protein [Candidatus Gracilibacteria bacterium]|nr:amidohydrolase family protein [Candidatus Gracilibacteria bacterium]
MNKLNRALTKTNKKVFGTINKIESEIKLNKNKERFLEKLNKLETSIGPKYPMVDAHLHLVDFLGETEGIKNLIYYMDKSNIEKAVIFGTALKKIWAENERERPEYYLDDDNECYYDSGTDTIIANEFNSLSKKEKERFYPLLCGFNPMDIDAVKQIERTIKYNPGVFCGIGEVLYRHDDLTFQTQGEAPRMNTKATSLILEFVSKYDLPIMIHNNITSPSVSDYPKYLHELETMLMEYPKAKVIFAHCGASRRLNAPYYAKMIDRLLTEYPSLYVDYSWVVFDDIISINDVTKEEWIQLTEKFSDRVMIGSDILGNGFYKVGLTNSRYNSFLDSLSPETREKVCRTNAISLYKNSRNKVEKGLKIKYPSLKEVKF